MAVLALDESSSSVIGLITLGEKCAGKRSAGNPHAALDVAGAGNVLHCSGAPVLDPTAERRLETELIRYRASRRLYSRILRAICGLVYCCI